jgi:hypothetical protein
VDERSELGKSLGKKYFVRERCKRYSGRYVFCDFLRRGY